MEHYDAIIIGAGPAGGQCARELSAAGKRVLLVEKAKSFATNNYSSGGAYIELLEQFDLPVSVVGTYWNKFAIQMEDNKNTWVSKKPLGIVFDFLKLRAFLAEQTFKNGGTVRLGMSYTSHEQSSGKCLVHLKNHFNRDSETFSTHVLVDATGAERKVLLQDHYDKSKAVVSTGIEFLVRVKPEDHARYANTLTSFLGLKWMPQGYAWIFPMEDNQLKMGVIRYFQHDQLVPHDQSYLYYIENLMKQTLENHDVEILDKHGKTILYTVGRADVHYLDNVIAIGDAVSMLNPMAAEGIRHSLHSGRYASAAILGYLEGNSRAFPQYVKKLQKYCRAKWYFSEFVMNIVYKEKRSGHYLMMLEVFRKFTFSELMDLLFHYRTSKFLKFIGIFGWLRLKNRLKR